MKTRVAAARAAQIGFLFFFVKGLLWLAAPALAFWLF